MKKEEQHIKNLLDLKSKYQRLLEKQHAQFGMATHPSIIIELENVKQEVIDLRDKLVKVKQDAASELTKLLPCNKVLLPRTDLIGRSVEKKKVLSALSSRAYIIIIEGIGGVGKTALALEIIHESIKKEIFDRIIFIPCRENNELNTILDFIAKSLNYDTITTDLSTLTKNIYILLQKHRTLLVMDNFESVVDRKVEKFIQQIPEPCKILITTRKQYTTDNVFIIPLKGLNRDESLSLIKDRAKKLGLAELFSQSNNSFFERIHSLTGGVPLAIHWIIGQIKRGMSPESVIKELTEAKGKIHEEIFSNSWELLSENAKKIAKAITIFIAPVPQKLLMTTCDLNKIKFEKAIVQLIELFLIEMTGDICNPCYFLHSLTKYFVESYMSTDFAEFEKFYISSSNYLLMTLSKYAGRNNWLGYEGYDEIERNRGNIFFIRKWCFVNGKWEVIINMQNLLSRFLYLRGYWKERLEFGKESLFAAQQINDRLAQGLNLSEDIGYMLFKNGKIHDAIWAIKNGLKILIQEKDIINVSRCYTRLSAIYAEKKDFKKAIAYSKNAIKTASKISNLSDAERMIAVSKEHLSDIYIETGDLKVVKTLLLESESVFKKIGDKFRLVRVLFCKGTIEFKQESFSEAKINFKNCIKLAQEISRKDYEYCAYLMIAKIATKKRKIKKAFKYLKKAQEGFINLGATNLILEATKLENEIHQNYKKIEISPSLNKEEDF